MGQRYAPHWSRQGAVLAPAVGFQGAEQGYGAAFEVVDGAGSGQFPGRGDHPAR
jgi:hypothetical protein